jgi:recombination protein RecA
MKASENTLDSFDWIPTPFNDLNTVLGGGVPTKKITEVSGQWSVGKSTLALQVIAAAQKDNRPCLWCDSEFSFSVKYASDLGVNCLALELEQRQFAEETLDALETWATEHKNGVIVLDSIGALLPREEAEKGSEGRSIGLQARLIGSFTRRIVPVIALNNHALILLNHSFTDLGTGRLKTSGGAKLEYAKSIWITLKRAYGKQAKRSSDGKKTVLYIEVECRKNKLAAVEGSKCDLEFVPGAGFQAEPVPPKKRGRPPKTEAA